jgi:predicted DsbA family dithiol-disulfide isomerase
LGLYRLKAALAQFEHGDDVTLVHCSFELDPRAPAKRPQTMEEVLASKYGMSPEQVKAGHERLTNMGQEVGMEFDFARIQLGSTFDAHRIMQAARGTDAEDPLVTRLFADYFTEGRLLSDPAVLAASAASSGLDPALVESVLEGDGFAAEVRSDEMAAQDMGVTGVPHFVINGKWAVPGAQDVETLLIVLRRAWERTEAVAT